MVRKLAVLLLAALVLPLSACSNNASSSSSSTSGGNRSVTIAGSTALLPLVKQAAVDYQAIHPDAKINVSGGGSRVGVTQVAQKGADIGDSDIPAPGEPELIDHQVAVVPFAVVVNPASGITNLTKAEIVGIFSGKITNFKQVGGHDETISIVNRPHSSGTRSVFVEKLMGGSQPVEGGATQDSSGTVTQIVRQIPGAISYVSRSYIRGSIAAVSIDGVASTDANIISGKYPFWSYEHMFTNGKPNAAQAAFINFVSSDTAALKALGFIPVGKMKAH